MKPTYHGDVIVSLLFLCSPAFSQLAGQRVINTPVWSHQTIFVAEVEDAQNAPPPYVSQWTDVRVRVSRILKDGRHIGLEPSVFEVRILHPMSVSAANGSFWTNRQITTGQKYVIFSDSTKGLREMFEMPNSGELLTEEADPIADTEMILNTRGMRISEQSRNAALALRSSRKHSWILARYITAILAAGYESETNELAQALETDEGALSFSDDAKITILADLSIEFTDPRGASQNLKRVLGYLSLRYIAFESQKTDAKPTRLERLILQRPLAQFRRSEEDMNTLRSVRLRLASSSALQVWTEATLISNNASITSKERVEAEAVVELFSEKPDRR